MASEVKVYYDILAECIVNLETIMEEDTIYNLILSIGESFENSQSDTTEALKLRYKEYEQINNLLNKLASNVIDLIKASKRVYEQEDSRMAQSYDR